MKMRLAQSPGLARTERVFVPAPDSTNKQKISRTYSFGVPYIGMTMLSCRSSRRNSSHSASVGVRYSSLGRWARKARWAWMASSG
jgi:hypothetical protein